MFPAHIFNLSALLCLVEDPDDLFLGIAFSCLAFHISLLVQIEEKYHSELYGFRGARHKNEQNFCEKCGTNLTTGIAVINQKINVDSKIPLFPAENTSNAGKIIGAAILAIAVVLFFAYIDNSPELSENTEAQAKLEAAIQSLDNLAKQDDWTTKFDVSDVNFVRSNYSLYVTGIVQNKTNRDFSYLQIHISLFNAAGDRVGSAMDNLSSFSSKGRWKFKALVFDKDVKSCRIEKISAY